MPTTVRFTIEHPFSTQEIMADWISIKSPNGNFVVGAGHRPMLSLVSEGESVVYKSAGVEKAIEVAEGGALLHVTGNTVRLVLT
ncbi:MAG: hypothetical protein PVJ92_01125 [Candidatus Dependentiae bacterium]|jgi:F0F1-type ATP synthase epsilon subunit